MGRLQLELERGRAGVRDVRLPPDLDGERHQDERVQELEQPVRVVGQVIERKFVQVGDRLLGARKDGVVERLHLVHGARQAFRIALGLAGEAPLLGKGLEVGELGRQEAIGHRITPPLRALVVVDPVVTPPCSECRHMSSWSPSGKVETTRDSSPICVASRVPQSCKAYSLMVAMPSCWARRSRTLRRAK
jgi:hypothetical protein